MKTAPDTLRGGENSPAEPGGRPAGRASAFLALDVIRGELAYCADEDRCDAFELYVMRRAGDLAFFERERRRRALQPRVEAP